MLNAKVLQPFMDKRKRTAAFFLGSQVSLSSQLHECFKKKLLKAAFLDRRLDVFTMHSTKGITHSDPHPKLHNLPLVLQSFDLFEVIVLVSQWATSVLWFNSLALNLDF